MNQVIEGLHALHLVDLRIRELEEFLASAPGRKAQLTGERQAAEAELRSRREELEGAMKELRRQERALVDGEDKLAQIQVKLNQVKTNKEYEAALKEIEDRKRHNGRIEEEILELYDRSEAADREKKSLEAGWQERVAEFDEQERELDLNCRQTQTEFDEKTLERQQLVAGLPPLQLKDYELVRGARGSAVAYADREICQACFRRMPAQLYNQVLKGEEVLQCPNCLRFLVRINADPGKTREES